MDDFEIGPVDGVIGINYEKVLDDAHLSSITKETARKLMKVPYMTLGDWFKSLSNTDLTVLSFMAESIKENENALQDLIMLTEMLARAEGTESSNVDDVQEMVSHFIILITIVSLHRKGLVDVWYENMSFGADMNDKKVVQLKDGKLKDGVDYE